MTDNEIIKELNMSIDNFSKETLDLINRQKDKIKEFDEKIIIQQGLIEYQKTEIEKLNIESETLATQLKGAYEQIHKLNMAKSEAIKELWNKLQDYIFRDDFSVDGRLILDADEVKEVIQRELDK